jgi:predicted amidohydrolase
MLICWDLAFPEAFRELIAAGAKTIIIPTFWTLADCSPTALAINPLSEKLFLETTLTARAYENTCAIVFVNAGAPPGPEGEGSSYAGLSRVAVPFVGALGNETMDTNREGMSVVDVDMEMVEEAEKNYKVREDIAGEDWHYTYRHQESGLVE